MEWLCFGSAAPPRALAVPFLLCSACASVPDLGERPAARRRAADGRLDLAGRGARLAATAWWQGYGDAQLSQLIDEALASSPTLEEAAARVRRADAIAQQAGARLLPSVEGNAQAGAVRSRESRPAPGRCPRAGTTAGQFALALSYDLDLWGGNRATLRAAMSDADAARADAAAVRAGAVDRRRLDLCRARPAACPEGRRRDQPAHPRRQRAPDPGARDRRASRMARPWRGPMPGARAPPPTWPPSTSRSSSPATSSPPCWAAVPPAARRSSFPARRSCAASACRQDLGIEIVGRRPDIVAARLRTEALGSASRRRGPISTRTSACPR